MFISDGRGGMNTDRYISQMLGLNFLIYVTVEVESW